MTTTAYNLGSILGAQIRSVLEAETENAEAIAEFITSVGFEPREGETGLGDLRMIAFQMQRRNESGELQAHTINIPLLSILPIPMLSIEKAEFEFDLQIQDAAKLDRQIQSRANVKSSSANPVTSRRLMASFAKSQSRRLVPTTTSGTTTQSSNRTVDSNMSVKVTVVQTDFPLGVERLLNLSELGIQDNTN